MIQESVVLAGGASRRMGVDKAGIEIDGVPLVRRVAMALEVSGWPPTLLGGSPVPGYPFVEDVSVFAGPADALRHFQPRADVVFVASCDMPLFDGEVPSKMLGLLGDAQAVIPKIQGRAQPLCALYASDAFTSLRSTDSPRIMDWVQMLDVVYADEATLGQIGIALDSICSANTPEELQKLLRGGAQTKPLS